VYGPELLQRILARPSSPLSTFAELLSLHAPNVSAPAGED
jgi:hypothetical protein